MDDLLWGRAVAMRVSRRLRQSYEADLGEVRAFLPSRVPLDQLPPIFAPYLNACQELSQHYPQAKGGVRGWLDREFRRDDPGVHHALAALGEDECDTLMTALSALAHTYRWDAVPPRSARFDERRILLPPGIGGPWSALARRSRNPCVGTTWSLHLSNWRMKDRPGGSPYRPEELGVRTLALACNWLPPPCDVHLERFSLSFVLFEAKGARVLLHLVETADAAARRRVEDALASLSQLHAAIKAMTLAFSLNVRKATVDPDIWLELVQPTFPWSAESDEPGRVEAGPSGIQLGTVQALDAALGVTGNSTLAQMTKAGRRYLPARHRRFLSRLDPAGHVVRAFVKTSRCPELTERFNRCLAALGSFRAAHEARGCQYLRRRPAGEARRASTGLTIGVEDDALGTFRRTMAARRGETEAAAIR